MGVGKGGGRGGWGRGKGRVAGVGERAGWWG